MLKKWTKIKHTNKTTITNEICWNMWRHFGDVVSYWFQATMHRHFFKACDGFTILRTVSLYSSEFSICNSDLSKIQSIVILQKTAGNCMIKLSERASVSRFYTRSHGHKNRFRSFRRQIRQKRDLISNKIMKNSTERNYMMQ